MNDIEKRALLEYYLVHFGLLGCFFTNSIIYMNILVFQFNMPIKYVKPNAWRMIKYDLKQSTRFLLNMIVDAFVLYQMSYYKKKKFTKYLLFVPFEENTKEI